MNGEYHEHASKMRTKLNEVSPSLCLAKWQQVSIHLPNGTTQSCYHPPTHKIPLELLKDNPSVLHNTPIKIHERKLMLEGKRPEGCSYCWKVEDALSDDPEGHLSDRHYRSSEWWSAPTFDEVTTNNFDYNVVPRYVEINFNQACNFKCMYCSPHLSTAWEDETKKHGGYKLHDFTHNDLSALESSGKMPLRVPNKENPYVDAFWKWFPEIYRKLRIFRMTGGEPLMDKNTFKVLEYVNDNPHGQLELSITSNMCPPDQKLMDRFIDLVKKLETVRSWGDTENFNKNSGNNWYVAPAYKHFMLFVSLDGYGKQAEYMRHGMDFEVLLNNVKTYLRETHHSSISFINTFNLLSVPSLYKFLEMILDLRNEFDGTTQKEYVINPPPTGDYIHPPYTIKKHQRIWFDVPILRYPPWFSIQNAGTYEIEEVKRCIKFMEDNVQPPDAKDEDGGFKPYEILKIKRDLAIMQEVLPKETIELNKINFYMFITEHDKRRQTKFIDVFPELKMYWKECVKVYVNHH
jgi:hypothetical protein